MKDDRSIYLPTSKEMDEQNELHEKAMRMITHGKPLCDVVFFLRNGYKSARSKHQVLQVQT